MDFKSSQTMCNLARAFAGESQARTRYAIYAKTAEKENYPNLAQVFTYTASQELAHAEVFLNNLIGHGGAAPSIDIHAGYPFELGNTLDNLRFAMNGENDESTTVYPSFAQTAREEGFEDIARLFDLIAKIETRHAARYEGLFARLNQNSLYSSSFPTAWVCQNCGNVITAEKPWVVCPVCGKEQGYIEMLQCAPELRP